MNKKKMLLHVIMSLGLAIGAFLWRCVLTAFVWAGWGGFGGISMEYTKEGGRVVFIAVCIPPLLLLFLLLMQVRRIRIGKNGENLLYLFFFAAAIGIGILAFYAIPELCEPIVKSLKHIIASHPGWMSYPTACITPHPILAPLLPDGCVVKSSGIACTITLLPMISETSKVSVRKDCHA